MANTASRGLVLMAAISLGLAACGGSSMRSPNPANSAPTIAGTPAASVTAGSAYDFTPSASDADNDALAFSITGKPSWATFSVSTGKLSGTPTSAQTGTYLNIVIRANDGQTSTALPTFAITVTPPAAAGTATLSWAAPAQNTDGSTLTNLAGYRIYHGTSAGALTDIVELSGTSVTSYVYDELAAGTHYFAVAAYNNSGAESALSGIGSKTIP